MDRPLRILLIEDDEDVCERFFAEIEETEDIVLLNTTNNSYHALELVKDELPDAVILDLELNKGQGNGLNFLRKLKSLYLSVVPYILITTNNSSATTHDCARELGADFIFLKHQEDYSERNAIDFLKMMSPIIFRNQQKSNPQHAATETPAQRNQRLKRIISAELDHIGINANSVGYKYLIDAILLAIDGQTANIYTTIAKKFKKTNAAVERGMQNAIGRAWRTADLDDLLLHYTAKVNSERGVPTLTEFIFYYANKIKNEH